MLRLDAHQGLDASRGARGAVDDGEGQGIVQGRPLAKPSDELPLARERSVRKIEPGFICAIGRRIELLAVLVSPFTPGYVATREQLSILADVGVVLLLFEVGIEINPLRLARERRRLLWLAPAQVLVTWILSAAVCFALGIGAAGLP